jgi:hypothetical protein
VAKPRPVSGLDPDKRIRPNARRVLAVRIDEVYGYDGLVADPANVRELHDMRIAFKRLRYLLEIFGIAFDADLEPFLAEVKAMQDLLGEIHDCDVQIPMLEEHLAWLAARESGAARRLVAEAPRRRARPGGRASEAAGSRWAAAAASAPASTPSSAGAAASATRSTPASSMSGAG